mgnify:CR=1 FL=1|tara:strand:+ start:264 stop:845 length:582 start_codon:yes stop_codon:yes gene_type:complete
MAKRKAYAPFSLTSEAGVAQTPVEGYIDVEQKIYPIVNTGTVNENGRWAGVKASDEQFIGLTKAEGIANGGQVLFPDTGNFPSINMTGFNDIFVAIKPTNGGTYKVKAVSGPDTIPFANLSPVNSGTPMRGAYNPAAENMNSLLLDTSESLTANVWSIYYIEQRLKSQRNMQFEVTNDSGDISTVEFGFMRLL